MLLKHPLGSAPPSPSLSLPLGLFPALRANRLSHLGSANFDLRNNRGSGATVSWLDRHSLGFVGGKSTLPNCCTRANHSSVRLGTQRSIEGFALRIARAVFCLAFLCSASATQLRRRRETNDEEIQP